MNDGMKYLDLHCTDALPNTEQINYTDIIITKKILERIELDLEEYEKISILFLVGADILDAYEEILNLYKNRREQPNILTEFLKSDDVEQWSCKLFEAICLIDNREVIKNLGFVPHDIAEKYHRNINRYAVHVHPVSKVLYKLFESMDDQKAKQFLKSVYQDEAIAGYLQNEDHLEVHAVHWLQIKFINILTDCTGELTKLLKHLKRLDYACRLIYEDVEFFSTKKCGDSPCLADAPRENVQTLEKKRTDCEKCMIRRGKLVLINEECFSGRYETRKGTRRDGENLKRTFAGLGFSIEEFKDLRKDEILKTLRKMSENFDKEQNCLVVAILSHGYEGGIISSDEKEISTDAIEEAVCTERLYDIAKILIIQACQGSITGDASREGRLALDGPGNKQKYKKIVHLRNFARFMSTMRGFNSIRHKEEGSWFIQAICEILSNSKGKDENCGISVEQWCTRVTRRVSNQVGYLDNCAASQIPELTTRLEADVYFPPYDPERAKNY